MRKFLTITLLTLMTLPSSTLALTRMSVAAGATSTLSELEAEVTKASRALDEAWTKQDGAALALLLADEFICTNDGKVHNKTQEIAQLKSADLKMEFAAADDAERRIRIYGDTALETGSFTFRGTFKGKPFSEYGRYTTTWIKRDGRWQMVADHISLINE